MQDKAQVDDTATVTRAPGRPLDHDDIIRRFTYHRPEGNKVIDHEDVRLIYKEFALALAGILPDGREKSLAFTELEASSFWAHAGIARFGK